MSLKAKIKARLKAKFSGVNLSTKRIDAIADKLKLEEDAEDDAIDERLDELNEIFSFAEMAKNDDRLRTLEAKQKPPKKEDDNDEPDSPADPKKPTDPEMPAWAKALVDSNKALAEKLERLESGKTADTRKQTLEGKLKDVDPKFKSTALKAFGRMKFESDEDFETYLSEIEEDAKEFALQTQTDDIGLSRPLLGSTTKTGISSGTAAYIADKKAAAEGKGAMTGKSLF